MVMMAFKCSGGRVTAYKSGLSPLLNFLATIRERICIGSLSNAFHCLPHFVSIGVTLYFATAACSSTSYTPSSRRYFSSRVLLHSLPRQFLSSDVVEALDELVLLTSSSQHRILLWLLVLLLAKPLATSRRSQLLDHSSGSSSPILQLSYHPSQPSSLYSCWWTLTVSILFTNFPTTPSFCNSTQSFCTFWNIHLTLLHQLSNSRIIHLVLLHRFSNFPSIRLGLRHQFSYFSNLIDLQVLRESTNG